MFTVHICCFLGQKSNIRYGAPFHNVRYTLYHSFCCIISFTVLQKKANKKQRFTSCKSGKACASYPPSIQVAVAMWSIDVWEKNSRSLVLNGSFVVYGNPRTKWLVFSIIHGRLPVPTNGAKFGPNGRPGVTWNVFSVLQCLESEFPMQNIDDLESTLIFRSSQVRKNPLFFGLLGASWSAWPPDFGSHHKLGTATPLFRSSFGTVTEASLGSDFFGLRPRCSKQYCLLMIDHFIVDMLSSMFCEDERQHKKKPPGKAHA